MAFIMKKSIIFTIFLLCISNTTFAQNIPNNQNQSQNKIEIDQKITEKRALLQSEIDKKKAEVRTLIESKKQDNVSAIQVLARERILKAIEVLFERMEAFIVRYDKIITRLENRISTMNPESQTEAQALLAVAKSNLNDSITLISATKSELTNTLQTQTAPETIRMIISISTESLKKTHESLIDVIRSLKADDIEASLTE
jgi:hypothetical protein